MLAPQVIVPKRRELWKPPPVRAYSRDDVLREQDRWWSMSMVLSALPLYMGGADPFELWQPTTVTGFVLDINPHFQLTQGTDGPRITATQIVNNAPSASDAFANSNPSLQPTYDPSGWVSTSYTRPSVLFNGVSEYFACTTSIGSTLVGGADTAFTMFVVGQHLSVSGTRAFVFMGRSTSGSPLWDFYSDSGLHKSLKRDDGATQVQVTGGTPDTNPHVFEFNHSGVALGAFIDGSSVINASQNVGTLTIDRMSLGATFAAAVPANFANFKLARLLGFTGSLNSTDADYVRSVLTSMYM